jgi:TonB family protein
MIGGIALDTLWREVAAHLWQTTVVLLALVLIARTMKGAPARLLNSLWWVGFAKIFMPIALLGHVGRWLVSGLGALPYLRDAFPWLFNLLRGGAVYVLEPGIRVVAAAPAVGQPVRPAYIVISVIWVLGAALLLIRWTRLAVRERLARARPLPLWSGDVRARLEPAARGGGVNPENIRVLEGRGVPAVAGILRPRILIPERSVLQMDPEELRAVLLHEEAHRRRLEPLRLALQKAALTVFFFYPPLWLLLRELNTSAEMACDEAVIEAGTGSRIYASAIARMMGLGLEMGPGVSVLGFGHKSPVRARLDRLEKNRRYIAMKRHRVGILAAVLTVAVLSFIPLAPRADSGTSAKSETALPAPPEPPEPPEVHGHLETQPELIVESVVLPEYPESARKAGIDGKVLLRVRVNRDGTVEDARVEKGIEGYPELGRSAVEAVKQWTFVPATSGGGAVEAEIVVPVGFGLEDSKPVEASTPPQLITELCQPPPYPETALKAGAEGKVFLEVLVKADGTVGEVSVREGIEGHPELDEAAREAVMEWKFKPAASDGVPVDMRVVVPVEFRLDTSKTAR